MSAQSILEHHTGCKAKCTKECAEQEGHEVKKSQKKKSKAQEQEKLPNLSSSGTDESCRTKNT